MKLHDQLLLHEWTRSGTDETDEANSKALEIRRCGPGSFRQLLSKRSSRINLFSRHIFQAVFTFVVQLFIDCFNEYDVVPNRIFALDRDGRVRLLADVLSTQSVLRLSGKRKLNFRQYQKAFSFSFTR